MLRLIEDLVFRSRLSQCRYLGYPPLVLENIVPTGGRFRSGYCLVLVRIKWTLCGLIFQYQACNTFDAIPWL